MTHKRELILGAVLLVLLVAFLAGATTQTIETLPTAGSTFLSDVTGFMAHENAGRDYFRLGGAVVTGGTADTAAALTHDISACTGFTNGYYVSQASVSRTYTDARRTFVYLRDDDERTITIPLATITYNGHFVYATMAAATSLPATPAGCLPLMQVDTAGGAITAVTDLRSGLVSAEGYGSLETAITTGASNRTVFLSEHQVLTADLTVPSTITLAIAQLPGGAIRNGSYGITFNGDLLAGAYQIFNGDGTVSGFVRPILPEWWEDIYAAVTSFGHTNQGTFLISQGHTIISGNSITFGENMDLLFLSGGSVEVASGAEIYVYSPILAGQRRIFYGAGTSVFERSAVSGFWGAWDGSASGFGINQKAVSGYDLSVAGQMNLSSDDFPDPIETGISGIGKEPITGRIHMFNLTTSETITGSCLYGGHIGIWDSTSEVTASLPTAKKGMNVLFSQNQGQAPSGASVLVVNFLATDNVYGLGISPATQVAAINDSTASGTTCSNYMFIESWEDGSWWITGASGVVIRNG